MFMCVSYMSPCSHLPEKSKNGDFWYHFVQVDYAKKNLITLYHWYNALFFKLSQWHAPLVFCIENSH